MGPRGWYTRQYLPHFDGGTITQFVTFHLHGCFSPALLARWQAQYVLLPPDKRKPMLHRRINDYLDQETNQAWLSDPYLAGVVENALCYFHGTRYALHAWVVMPNHVHVLFTPCEGHSLAGITHSWKSYTAHTALKYLQHPGPFWYPECYDRFIRNEEHYANTLAYIEMNPVKAGLCQTPESWQWGSARARHQ